LDETVAGETETDETSQSKEADTNNNLNSSSDTASLSDNSKKDASTTKKATIFVAVTSLVLIGGAGAFVGTNMVEAKAISGIISTTKSAAVTKGSSTSVSSEKIKNIKNAIKIPFIYFRFRNHTLITGKYDLENKGVLLKKAKYKIQSGNRLFIDVTKEFSTTDYRYISLRFPKRTMRHKQNIDIVYMYDDTVIDKDHFESYNDFNILKNLEKI
jgi:hypothetical protein